MYFKQIPKIAYLLNPADAQLTNNYVVMTDITKNVRFKKEVIDNIVLYDYYHLKDGETMEQLSERLYGTPHNHWVLMLLNDKYDWRSDMPLNTLEFEEYIITKYGSVQNAMTTIAFYRNDAGQSVSQTTPSLSSFQEDPMHPGKLSYTGTTTNLPVTAYDMESLLNEEKRRIKILSQKVMDTVLKNYEAMNA